ncbi:Succinylglutamate desuccinylase [Thalassocella blandensis]|nr:Succinylglutamate desuccinylase [Thalassocella blandensis]
MSVTSVPSTLPIYQYAGIQPGPKLLVFGAVHGNETCGTIAIRRVLQELENGALRLERGTLTLIPVVNPLAYQLQRRQGDRDMNRSMGITEKPQDFEDKLSNIICPILQDHDVLLDLHSFHTPGTPFALIGPANNSGQLEPFAFAEAEESLALHLGVSRFVEGWLETYAQGVSDRQTRGVEANVEYGVGTTEVMRRYGGIAVTLECGQHEEVQAPDVAYKAIRNTLAHLAMIHTDIPHQPPAKTEVIKLYRVVDKHHDEDRFYGEWNSFEKIKQGQIIAHRHDGTPLTAEKDGWIVFPNPEARVDDEWYYLAESSVRLR